MKKILLSTILVFLIFASFYTGALYGHRIADTHSFINAAWVKVRELKFDKSMDEDIKKRLHAEIYETLKIYSNSISEPYPFYERRLYEESVTQAHLNEIIKYANDNIIDSTREQQLKITEKYSSEDPYIDMHLKKVNDFWDMLESVK